MLSIAALITSRAASRKGSSSNAARFIRLFFLSFFFFRVAGQASSKLFHFDGGRGTRSAGGRQNGRESNGGGAWERELRGLMSPRAPPPWTLPPQRGEGGARGDINPRSSSPTLLPHLILSGLGGCHPPEPPRNLPGSPPTSRNGPSL